MTGQEQPRPRGMSRFTACALVVLLSVCVLYGCGCLGMMFVYGDAWTNLSGEVVEPDGKPIPGATVTLAERESRPNKVIRMTDEAGRYEVSLGHAGRGRVMVVTVSKSGYKEYRQEFKAHEPESVPKRIVLEPDPQAPVVPKE
jgi:Carboxypeptidase regulatory-like domain